MGYKQDNGSFATNFQYVSKTIKVLGRFNLTNENGAASDLGLMHKCFSDYRP